MRSDSLYHIATYPGQIKPWATYHIYYPGEDVVEDIYWPDPARSWLYISKYDSTTRIVEGRFELFMPPNGEITGANNPDTAVFRHGQFRLKIKEEN